MNIKTVSKERTETSVRLAAFLLVIASGVALSLTQKLLIPSLLLIGTTMVAWTMARKPAKGNFWEIASFCYLIFFLFDLFRISSALAPALVHLFIFIMINKIFNLHTYRDYYQLYLLTFLTVLAASSLSVEVEMFYMIIVYIFLLVWNILSLTLFREWQKQETDDVFPFSFFHPIYFVFVLASSVVTFAIALLLFFLVPRLQLGYLSRFSAGKTQHVSGFSQNVSLGEIAQIQQDPNVAMRVKVTYNEPLQQHLYWRGIAFDHYDGHSWSTAKKGTHFLREDIPGSYINVRSIDAAELLVKQEFYLTPLDTRVIFGLDRVMRIDGSFLGVTRDDNGTLTSMSRLENYTVYSRISNPTIEALKAASSYVPEAIGHYYLQLPDTISGRIFELAEKITEHSPTKYERVIAIKTYLEENYTYTTTDLPQSENDPVSVFLFDRKSGHCEYFATSMVLLLRSLGIPARLVNGFLEGQFNNIGDFYVVRQSDAHSWVEVYFDGAWVFFDPSPRAVTAAGSSSFFSRIDFQKIFESISFFWDRYILIFSGQDQLDALTFVQDQYRSLLDRAEKNSKNGADFINTSIVNFLKKNRTPVGAAATVLLMLILAFQRYRNWKQRLKVSRTPVLFYREMLSILQRKGYHRLPQKTPAEFIESVSRELPADAEKDLIRLTEMFYRSRFGNYPLSTEEQISVRESLRRLQHL